MRKLAYLLLCLEDLATNRALLTCGKTCFGTGCILTCNYLLGVRKLFYSLGLSLKLVTADGALDYAVIGACLATAGVLLIFNNGLCGNMVCAKLCVTHVTLVVAVFILVSKGGYLLLLQENGAAKRTLFTIGKSGFGTGGSLTRNSLFLMLNGNLLLSEKSCAANRTLLTIGKSGFGTGGSSAGYDLFCVRDGRNLLTGHKSLTADRAFLALGQTVIGTGCILTGNDLLGMILERNFLLFNQGNTAVGTSFTFGKSCFRTACILTGNDLLGMILDRSFLLCYKNLTAKRAFFALGESLFRTAGLLTCYDLLGMAERLSLGRITARTGSW